MNQLKINQLKAAGGVAVELIEHIEYLQKTIDLANKCMKEKQERIDRQLSCLTDISNMCVGDIAMGYKLDPHAIGQAIHECTGKTNPELNEMVNKNEA